jgi:hypothetical protein
MSYEVIEGFEQVIEDQEKKINDLQRKIRYYQHIFPLSIDMLFRMANKERDIKAIAYFFKEKEKSIPNATRKIKFENPTVMAFLQDQNRYRMPEEDKVKTNIFPEKMLIDNLNQDDYPKTPLYRHASAQSAPGDTSHTVSEYHISPRRYASSQSTPDYRSTNSFLMVQEAFKLNSTYTADYCSNELECLRQQNEIIIAGLKIEVRYRRSACGSRLTLQDMLYIACKIGAFEDAEYFLRQIPTYELPHFIQTDHPAVTSFFKTKHAGENFKYKISNRLEDDTPLIWAVRHGHPKIVELLLLEKSVDIKQKNARNETAWDIVVWNLSLGEQNSVIIDLLSRYGANDRTISHRNRAKNFGLLGLLQHPQPKSDAQGRYVSAPSKCDEQKKDAVTLHQNYVLPQRGGSHSSLKHSKKSSGRSCCEFFCRLFSRSSTPPRTHSGDTPVPSVELDLAIDGNEVREFSLSRRPQ